MKHLKYIGPKICKQLNYLLSLYEEGENFKESKVTLWDNKNYSHIYFLIEKKEDNKIVAKIVRYDYKNKSEEEYEHSPKDYLEIIYNFLEDMAKKGIIKKIEHISFNDLEKIEAFEYTTTKSGILAMWVGGGSLTSRGEFHTLVNKNFQPKKAIFIKRSGHLAASTAQAIVGLNKEDILLKGYHRRDVSKKAWEVGELKVHAYKFIGIRDEVAYFKEISIAYENIPADFLEGSNIYHNKDGEYFCNV